MDLSALLTGDYEVKIEPLERDEKQAMVDWCEVNGIFVRKRVTAGATRLRSGRWARLGEKNEADLWGIGDHGRHWECECKRKGKKPTVGQFAWLNLCTSYGAHAFWADCLEMFIENMKGIVERRYWL